MVLIVISQFKLALLMVILSVIQIYHAIWIDLKDYDFDQDSNANLMYKITFFFFDILFIILLCIVINDENCRGEDNPTFAMDDHDKIDLMMLNLRFINCSWIMGLWLWISKIFLLVDEFLIIIILLNGYTFPF